METASRSSGSTTSGDVASAGVPAVLDAALRGVPAELPRIVLSHNPTTFEENAGRIALQLSGHTHGGQVAVDGYPLALATPYVRGLYCEQGSSLYVNRRLGGTGPVARLGPRRR